MEKKQITFRSKYERHQLFLGNKKIKFVKNHFRTDDSQEIEFLRKQAAKSSVISEIKPEVKIVPVVIEEGDTEETALEKALTTKKSGKASKSGADKAPIDKADDSSDKSKK